VEWSPLFFALTARSTAFVWHDGFAEKKGGERRSPRAEKRYACEIGLH